MKLLMVCHMYVPHHNAGGETTIHAAFRELVNRGHSVDVICKPGGGEIKFEPYMHEGVKVVRPPERNEHQWFIDYTKNLNPDLILTHLDLTFNAMQLALDTDKPLAHFIHNSMQLDFHRVGPHKCQLAIFNSRWVAESQRWAGPQIILHPIVEPDRYRADKGAKITLVNPTPGKGEGTFYGLSRLMPDYEFLVVKSVYGEQVFPPNIKAKNFPNVEFMEHTPDIREVFRKTKVLLMPSDYESYGRVGVEAACSGIPTMAHPTEGLLESLANESPYDLVEFSRAVLKRWRVETPEKLKGGWVSGAGIFCDRDDLNSWKEQIEKLYRSDVYYRSRSDAALKLAASLSPEAEFDRLEAALMLTSENWLKRSEVGKVKMWGPVDRRYWETSDGRLVAEVDGRIPRDAIRLAVGIGGEMPEEVAIANGFITVPEAKAIAVPAENKAIEAPQENKARKRKTA